MSSITDKELIQTIMEAGNMTAAADKLFVTQPYLSKLLKESEDKIGTALFKRNYRSISITYAGQVYLNYLNQIEQIEKKMLADLSLVAQEKHGLIRVGVNHTLASTLLPTVYQIFNQYFPHIKFEFYEYSTTRLNQMLKNQTLDIVIGLSVQDENDFVQEILYTDQLYLVVSKNSPFYAPQYDNQLVEEPFPTCELNNLPLILLPEKFSLRRQINDVYFKEDINLNLMYETSNLYTAIGLVRKGYGNTLVPITGMNTVSFNNCNIFSLEGDYFKVQFVLYYLRDKPIPSYTEQFIEHLKEIFHKKSQEFHFRV